MSESAERGGRSDLMGSSPMLLQSVWWRNVKTAFGWSVLSDAPLVLRRTVGPFTIAYAPHAFGSDRDRSGAPEGRDAAGQTRDGDAPSVAPQSAAIAEALNTLLYTTRNANITLLRWDVPWSADRFDPDAAASIGLKRAPIRVQPPDTVIVPLGDDDAMLAAMKAKTRYNVRLAAKKGVTITVDTAAAALAALPTWYALYEETARRDAIAIHSEQYYYTVIKTALDLTEGGEAAPRINLYRAYHEDDLLGGIIVASWRGVSTYLYGASSNAKRNLMASYLLQWRAMCDARDGGDHSYDMFGIPSSSDPDDPMYGLYRFKTGFGGRIVHRAGAWDALQSPVGARLYRTAERLRGWYYYRFRKR